MMLPRPEAEQQADSYYSPGRLGRITVCFLLSSPIVLAGCLRLQRQGSGLFRKPDSPVIRRMCHVIQLSQVSSSIQLSVMTVENAESLFSDTAAYYS
jgi:hypothetical protein